MGHTLILKIARRYATKFFVKIEQITVQGDYCHLLIRAPRRSKFHAFFRVVAGQIAQRLELEGLLNPAVTGTQSGLRSSEVTDTPPELRKTPRQSRSTVPRKAPAQRSHGTGLWKYRPFSRVVRGQRAYKIVRDYVKLNELEAQGLIPYRKSRLKGLSTSDWQILWA